MLFLLISGSYCVGLEGGSRFSKFLGGSTFVIGNLCSTFLFTVILNYFLPAPYMPPGNIMSAEYCFGHTKASMCISLQQAAMDELWTQSMYNAVSIYFDSTFEAMP